MTAYYNEIDPYCVDWLRNLIHAKLIAPGEVDTRDIRDVRPIDLVGFTQCHFFAGLGGWSYALRLAAWPDHRPVWTGSCPCQPFSTAGQRRGFADERHLWPYWHWLIGQRRPAIILGEQVASASQWLGLVRGDLEALDYAVGTIPIEAASAGADHLRDRYWFLAYSEVGASRASDGFSTGQPYAGNGSNVGHSNSTRLAFGSVAEVERGDLRHQGPSTAAPGSGSFDLGISDRTGWQQGQLAATPARHRHSTFAAGSGALSNTERERIRGTGPTETFGTTSGMQDPNEQRQRLRPDARPVCDTGEYDWVLGADGKARRVKPGVRLLADGISARVAKLRAYGNAIDPRPAQAFVESVMEILA